MYGRDHLFQPFRLPPECGAEYVEYADAENRTLIVAPPGAAAALGLSFRAVGVALRDAAGRVFVRRNPEASGRWDFSAGGLVRVGECPEDTALRETEAALGLRGIRFVRVPLPLPETEGEKRRLIVFLAGPARPDRPLEGMFLDEVALNGLLASFPELFAPDLARVVPSLFAAVGGKRLSSAAGVPFRA